MYIQNKTDKKRQEDGKRGEINNWYIFIAATPRYFIFN